MFDKLAISRKLGLVLWVSALAAYAVAGAGLLLYQNLTLQSRARQAMEPYAKLVTVGTDTAVAFKDPVRAQEILDTLRANPQIMDAAIYLDDGRVLASFIIQPSSNQQPPSNKPDGIYLSDDTAEMLEALGHGARLRLTMSLGQLREQTRQILWLFGAMAFVLLAITLSQQALLQRAIIRPITTLASVAEHVRSRADYDKHVPVAGADEVALLGRSFNAMMEAVQARERDLQRLALFQQTLVNSAAYGIISCEPDGLVTSINPAAEGILGYTAGEVVGRQTPMLWHDPEEVAQRARQLSEELGETIAPGFEVFNARACRGLPEENEWTFICKDETLVPVLISVTALRAENEKITGFVSMIYDLTERKRAEDQIRQLNLELEKRVRVRTSELEVANKELEAFAYSVSHDLRAPLRHIDGFVEQLQKKAGTVLDEQGRHYMDTISDSAQRMGELIDNLLSFSRMGRQAITFQAVDLEPLVRDVIRELAPDAAGRNIEWRIGDLPVVRGDAALLRMVLRNLIANALKFTGPRQQARIEFGSLPRNEGEDVIFVRDNGVGFDMAYADKLFGVFQRLHRSEEFEGTGIGLANVHRIIARHRGRAWAEAALGKGATIYFSLPSLNQNND